MPRFQGGGRPPGGEGRDHRSVQFAREQERDSVRQSPGEIEWIDDETVPERKRNMLEKARELHCEEAIRVLFVLLRQVKGFTYMNGLYLPPDQTLVQKMTQVHGVKGGMDMAWKEVKSKQSQFDIKDTRGGSDWGRLIGVLRAATAPGEGIPGLFEVRAPVDPRQLGNQEWQKFAQWCKEQSLSARGLGDIAHNIAEEFDALNIDEIIKKVQELSLSQLDHVLMSGFHSLNDDIRVFDPYSNAYKDVEGIMRDLNPEREKKDNERASEAASEARDNYLKEFAFQRVDEKGKKKWLLRGRVSDRDWNFHVSKGNDIFDDTYQATLESLHTLAEPLEISNQSAAVQDKRPTACIVSVKSRRAGRLFGHGVHPISPELIRAVAGEDSLWAEPPQFFLNTQTGQMCRSVQVHLLQDKGPVIGKEVTSEQGMEGAKGFAKILATSEGMSGYIKILEEKLSFYRSNLLLVGTGAENWYARSQGRLDNKKFDLLRWYQEKLALLGNITSLDEAQKKAKELTLEPTDLFLGQEALVKEVDHQYPELLQFGEKKYPLDYTYAPAGRRYGQDEPEYFDVRMEVPTYQKENFLKLPSNTKVAVGPENAPTAVQFVSSNGLWREPMSDVQRIQEILDSDWLFAEWQRYPEKSRQWNISCSPLDALPDPAAALLGQDISAYTTAKNGEPKFPVPGIAWVGQSKVGEQIQYGARVELFSTRTQAEAKTKESLELHQRNQEREKRRLEADPELIKVVETERLKFLSELEKIEIDNFYYRMQVANVNGWIRRVNQSIHESNVEDAREALQQAKDLYEVQIRKPWELFVQARKLYQEIGQKFPWASMFEENWIETIQRHLDQRMEWRIKIPTGEEVQELIARFEKIVEGVRESKRRMAEWDEAYKATQERRKNQTPGETEIEKQGIRQEIEKLLGEIEKLLRRPARYHFHEKDISRMKEKLQVSREIFYEYVKDKRDDFYYLDDTLERLQSMKQSVEEEFSKMWKD